jgi:hypothetical protein
MTRGIAGIAGGLVVWMLVATVGNLALRFAWAGYADVEKEMTFTLAMLFARLILGAVASFCAGAAVSWITKRNDRVVAIFATILFVLFIPVHYELWGRFPAWYHVLFFASLAGTPFLGAALYRRVT